MQHARRLLVWAAVPISSDRQHEEARQRRLEQLLGRRLARQLLQDPAITPPSSQPPLSPPHQSQQQYRRSSRTDPTVRRSVSVNIPGVIYSSVVADRELPDILLHACPVLPTARHQRQRRQPPPTVAPPTRKVGRTMRQSLPARPSRVSRCGLAVLRQHLRKISVSDTLRQVGRDLRRIADHLQVYKLLARPRDVHISDQEPAWSLSLVSGLMGCLVIWGCSSLIRRTIRQ